MSKTSNINVRVDSELKAQAESVLAQLGIPVSSAINIFLKQVVMQRGLPFEVKLNTEKPISAGLLSEYDLNLELEKGYSDYVDGNTKVAEDVFNDLRKDYEV